MADDLSDAPLASGTQQELSDAPWGASHAATTPEPKKLNWSDVPLEALKNAPSSALKFGADFVQPFVHPIDTASSLGSIGLGTLEKLGIMSGTEHAPYADAVGKFLVDRYGSAENIKHTLASDPVGMAADVSMLLSGGSSALARVPGVVGRTAEIAGSVGRAVNPVTAATKAAKLVGSGAAGIVGGLGTHTGGDSLRIAANAGYQGGEAARAFRENMRGTAPMEDTLNEARGAVQNLRQQRGDLYRAGMADIGADATVLDFNKIDQAINKVAAIKNYKGQDLSPATQNIRQSISEAVSDWKALDPKEFHTAEGLDALKQKIGDLRDATQYGTPERVVADNVYHAVRNTIATQAPEYAKVMKGYEEASKQIKDIEKTLSLNPNASVDTALRKLQSVLRNNANTNYGRRGELAKFLVDAGAPHLMERLSGQALSSWMPRGLGKLGMQIGAELAAMGAGASGAGLGAAAALGATGLAMSPRLMGEAAYYGGAAARVPGILAPGATPAFQAGRLANIPRITVHPRSGYFGTSPTEANENKNEVPGFIGNQKHGGRITQQNGFARGGAVKPEQLHGPINREFDVPYLAGAADNGRKVYIDRRVPATIRVKLASGRGYRMIDPALPLAIHERVEHAAMKAGKPYEKAHIENGTAKEREWVESHGLDWKHYEEILDGLLAHIEHEHPKHAPKDLYLKPYPHDKQEILRRAGAK